MKKGIAFCFVAMNFLFTFSLAYGQPAPLWRTGQTMSYATGDDGALQRGIASPTPRFMDNGDGTVMDNLTGLMWLKDASCFWTPPGMFQTIPSNWQDALNKVADLNANPGRYSCGGYKAAYNDWRLPNRKELRSLTDFSRYDPALPEGHPFLDVRATGYNYWSSTTVANYDVNAFVMYMYDGSVTQEFKSYWAAHVWPVRAGQTGETTVPTVVTTAVSSITSNSALGGGNVTSNGGVNVTAKGVCWSTSTNPTTGDSKTINGSGIGSFTSSITGLSSGITYHVRAYATNSVGTGYGNDVSFTASYASNLYVSISGDCGDKTPCYGSIQEAIDAANSGTTIKIQSGIYSEHLTSTPETVIFWGGWDETFTTNSSTSTVNSLTITDGKIIVDNLVIQ